ncbi:hypothetical protein [Paenibacillus sp. 1P07SE]|uniref:hypothetical protein n=1 Tax=Paenibacillus sp. 1P07SE TaxID=3132209 RepID=UPI0039A6BC5B
MTYRSLDLQISVPRTPDAGGLQSQMMNRPIMEQEKLAEESLKTEEELRRKSSEVEASAEPAIRDDEKGRGGSGQQRHAQGETEENHPPKESPAPHPYKGKHIDISL